MRSGAAMRAEQSREWIVSGRVGPGQLVRWGIRLGLLALAFCCCLMMMRQSAFAQAGRRAFTSSGALSGPAALPARAVAGRFLVVYRNGVVPSDVASRLLSAGAHLLRRSDRFGIAVAGAGSLSQESLAAEASRPGVVDAAARDARTLDRLRLDPDVEFVVHDVVVSADRVLRIGPVIPANPPQTGFERSGAQGGLMQSGALLGAGRSGGGMSSQPASGDVLLPLPGRFPHPQPVRPIGTGAGIGSAQSSGATIADGYYTSTGQDWGVKQVGGYGHGVAGAPEHGPWDASMGQGVRIAVLDSGVDAEHPDIAPNLVVNMTEVDQTAFPSVCDDGSPQDQQGHGTWTASLAAGAMGANTGLMIGVAPQAEILNIKVLQRMPTGAAQQDQTTQCEGGEASGLLSWVIQGIDDAVGQHADVVSLSLGVLVDLYTGEGAGLQASFDRATHAAALAGTVVVAAAGNDGFDLSNPQYIELPAQSRDVLAVVASTNPNCMENLAAGATCQDGPVQLAYYSNYGAPLGGVAAPGGSYPEGADAAAETGYVRGACSNGKPNTADGLPSDSAHSFGCFGLGHQQYVQAMGTSASAPLAAGVAALLRGAHPDWDAYAILNAMRSSATRGPGDVSTSVFNYGQVNAASALSLHWKSY